MKATALYATLCLVLGSPAAFSKSEDQARCPQCVQKDRTIGELQGENTRLKGLKETPKLTAEAASNEKVTTASYTVRPGDTLERIARRTGCSPIALGKANGLKNSTIIHPGQTLKVPAGTSTSAPASKPSSTASTYTIRNGDTYTSISKKTGLSVSSLTAANPKVKATSLRTGQVIQLRKASAPAPEAIVKSEPAAPVRTISAPAVRTISNAEPLVIPVTDKPTKTEAPKVDAPKPKLEKAPEPQQHPAPAAPKEEKQPAASQAPTSPPMGNSTTTVRSIIVQDETTFEDFAMSYGTSPAGLNELNGLSLKNETVLAKGSELYIPAQP